MDPLLVHVKAVWWRCCELEVLGGMFGVAGWTERRLLEGLPTSDQVDCTT